jgi:hypothetical protein
MNAELQRMVTTALEALQKRDYATAAEAVEGALRASGQVSRAELETVAARVGDRSNWTLFFERTDKAKAAHPHLERIAGVFEELLPESEANLNIREALSFVVALAGDPARAAELYRSTREGFNRRYGPYHDRTMLARQSLAIQLRNTGRNEEAYALFDNSGVCEDLKPVEDYIRAQGVRVYSVGRPWEKNCRRWVCFEHVVLDVEALRARFDLPDHVVVQTYRDHFAGEEHGLVCTRHGDALMGAHPDVLTAGGKPARIKLGRNRRKTVAYRLIQ